MSSRTRQFLQEEWFQLAVLAVAVLAALAAMPFATERVPMQWNLRGQVNWYAPAGWGLLVLPVAMLLTYGVFYLREALDRSRLHAEDGRLSSHGKAVRTIRLVMSLLVLALCLLQIANALGRHPDFGRLSEAAAPFALALVGNFFGKLKPNRYLGVRVPWTLRSETVWRKTHRVAGRLYTGVGLVAGTLCLLLPSEYVVEILAAWLALIILVPLGVAWQASREERTAQTRTAGLSMGWMAALEAVVLVGAIVLFFQHAGNASRAAAEQSARAARVK
ncbi:MAG TPA: SdpI family protein [Chthoniobacteraceae bacterium]|jgi:uncharacterized membrane protein|nr:SdpI family protein [Chthoniobacteraceae bacterium]